MTDYHDFTTINTPKEERKKLCVGDIWINAAECLKCGELIRSKNRHDYVTCRCGNLSVDGGSMYAKRVFKDAKKYVDLSVVFNDVKD